MNPPHFATAGTAAPETESSAPEAHPFVSTGFASIDRVLQTPPHPVVARWLRGEATNAELAEVNDQEEDSGIAIEELSAWLSGRGPGCDPIG